MQQFKALDRCSGTGILEEKHGGKSGSQCNDAVEELRYSEALSVFCQKRNGCVSVLRNAAGKKDREWNHSCRKQCNEYHVRSGLRNNAYEGRQKDHEHCVVAYPLVDVDVLKAYAYDKKDTECPCEYGRKMLLYDMVPKMLFYKMVRCKQQDEEHYDAESGKKYIHPVFAQKVYVECAFAVLMMTGSFMTVVLARLCMNMTFMACMGLMVMAQMACA